MTVNRSVGGDRAGFVDYLVELLDDDTGITWLCDLGQHDECDGYACVCCGHGHPGVPSSGRGDDGAGGGDGRP